MEAWDSRLFTARYLTASAARYVGMPVGQVRYWNHVRAHGPSGVSREIARSGRHQMLSYPELMELAVVASFKKAGLGLGKIRVAHHYLTYNLGIPYPFATEKLSTEGTHIIMDMPSDIREQCRFDHLILADRRGQFAWRPVILDRYHQFVYENHPLPARWWPHGHDSSVVVDPVIAFGQPTVNGIPTGVLADRFRADGDLAFIADDYQLDESVVREALRFEGLAA